MCETRSMDGASWLQHPQLWEVADMLEAAKHPRWHLAGSLQQLAPYLWNSCVKPYIHFCTPPQAKFPFWISGTHSQSNTGLKPPFHIPHHQIILALFLKRPTSDHFATPPPLVPVILVFLPQLLHEQPSLSHHCSLLHPVHFLHT